jgi:peptidoglycan hydrolase CwlO-like protein
MPQGGALRDSVAIVLRTLPSRVGRAVTPRAPRAAPRLAVVALAVAVAVGGSVPGAAQSDPRTERERVRSERASAAAEVDALQADDTEVDAALQALGDHLRGRQASYRDAVRASEQADEEAAAARRAVEAKEAEIVVLRQRVADRAVAAYVNPPTEALLDTFEADSARQSVQKRTFYDLRAGGDADLLDELQAAEAELEERSEAAQEASTVAAERAAEAEAELDGVRVAYTEQAEFAAAVQQRLDAKLSEAAALADQDASLSEQIQRDEAALVASLRRLSDAATEVERPRGGGAPGSGGTRPTAPSAPVPVRGGSVPLTDVRGIVVNSAIAGQLESMLAAAAADGFVFGGTGYRDSQRQIELRMQHCGTSSFAIYEMSPDACRPPTARPGASKHEQGLAVDLSWNGSVINSRSSPAFAWLAANAGRYGFANLPSEPWHWSTDGS